MDRQTKFSFSRVLSLSWEETLSKVKEALKGEGFGILCEVDVQKILKEKINRNFSRYLILGACNPSLASQVLEAEPEIGVFLPCNIVMYEEGGQTKVSAMDPQSVMAFVENARISAVASEVRGKLVRVLNSL